MDLQLQQVTRILGKDLKWDLSKEMCTALDTTKEKVQPLVSATGLGSSKGSRLAAAALLAAYIQLTMPDQHLEWTDLLEAASAHLNAQLDSERATALTQAAKHVVLGQPEHIVPLPKPKPPPKGAPAPSRASPASPVPRGAPAPPGAAPATGEGAAPAPVPVSEPVASPDPVVLGPGPSHAPRPSEPAMPETPQVAAMEATRRVSGLLSASSASAVSEPHEHTLGGSHGRTLSEPPTEATAEASDGEPGSPQLADAVMADAPDTDGLLQTSKSSSSSGRGMKGLMKKKCAPPLPHFPRVAFRVITRRRPDALGCSYSSLPPHLLRHAPPAPRAACCVAPEDATGCSTRGAGGGAECCCAACAAGGSPAPGERGGAAPTAQPRFLFLSHSSPRASHRCLGGKLPLSRTSSGW